MKITIGQLRGLIREAIEEQDAKVSSELKGIMDQALEDLVDSLENVKPDKVKADGVKKEAVGLAVAGAVIAAPAVLKIIGKTIKWISAEMGKLMGNADKADAPAFAAKLIKVAEDLHHLYVAPIRKVVGKLFPDKPDEWKDAWTDRLFHLIIAAFLISSGTGTVTSVKGALQAMAQGASTGSHLTLGTLEAAMTAIKTQEIWVFLAEAGAIRAMRSMV